MSFVCHCTELIKYWCFINRLPITIYSITQTTSGRWGSFTSLSLHYEVSTQTQRHISMSLVFRCCSRVSSRGGRLLQSWLLIGQELQLSISWPINAMIGWYFNLFTSCSSLASRCDAHFSTHRQLAFLYLYLITSNYIIVCVWEFKMYFNCWKWEGEERNLQFNRKCS